MNKQLKFISLVISALIITTLTSTSSLAQDHNKEIGLYMSSFSGFDLIYKKKRAENKFLRFRTSNLSSNFTHGLEGNNSRYKHFQLGMAIGWEKRKAIAESFYFYHGIEPSFNAGFSISGSTNKNQSLDVSASLGYVFGLSVDASDKLSISAETIPSIKYTYTHDKYFNGVTTISSDNSFLNAALSANVIRLTLSYKFTK